MSSSSTTSTSASAPPRHVIHYDDKEVQIFSSAKDLQQALGPYLASMSNEDMRRTSITHTAAACILSLCLCLSVLSLSLLLSVSALNSVAARGLFSVAFSGGSLPQTVGQALTSEKELTTITPSLDKWHIFFADERLVSLDDQESNYNAVKQSFLQAIPTTQTQQGPLVHTINEALITQPAQAAADYEQQIKAVVPDTVFDLILLGMGPDGHTCSLFPGHPLLNEDKLLIASITDSPKPPPQRITFTLPLVNKARHVVFVITGDKADALHTVLDQPEQRLPASQVKAENTAFFVDTKAASKLTKAKL